MTQNKTLIEKVGKELQDECMAIFGSAWNNDNAWRFAKRAITALQSEQVGVNEESCKPTGIVDVKNMYNYTSCGEMVVITEEVAAQLLQGIEEGNKGFVNNAYWALREAWNKRSTLSLQDQDKRSTLSLESQIKQKDEDLYKLRKIAAFVPPRIYIEAKEKAGFADYIVTKDTNLSGQQRIKLPENADEAEGMVKVGLHYLKECAPERLAKNNKDEQIRILREAEYALAEVGYLASYDATVKGGGLEANIDRVIKLAAQTHFNIEQALDKLEQEQDEVEHYETCECCQNFHRMEQKRDDCKAQIRILRELIYRTVTQLGKGDNVDYDTWKELKAAADKLEQEQKMKKQSDIIGHNIIQTTEQGVIWQSIEKNQ